jgi:hypothetical protein
MKSVRLVLVLTALLGGTVHAQAGLLAPTETVAGLTQNQWAEAWWNWALSFPEATNPVADPTGAFSSLGDQGQVFFLAGHFGGAGPVTRNATVRNDQFLFFPLANGVTTVLDSSYGTSYDGMRQDVIEFVGEGSDLYAEINGTSLAPGADLNGWLQLSPSIFVLNFPPGGIFTGGSYTGPIDSVQRGWWLMLAPLEVGSYTLRFGGTATPTGIYAGQGPNIQNVTYNLNVVPEPSSLTLAALALSAGFVFTHARRLRRRPA